MNAKIAIPQHSSESWEHPTPQDVVQAARSVMGEIDLDPASSTTFNERIKAKDIFTEFDDGLARNWHGRVFLNPPGGAFSLKESEAKKLTFRKRKATKRALLKERRALDSAHVRRWGTKSRAAAWWRKLAEEHDAGRVPEAIFVGFTLEILRSAQDPDGLWKAPSDFALCFPRERLEFAGGTPTHANVIVYIGPHTERFREHFSRFGEVKI